MSPQLMTSSNATSVKPDFSVEDSPCLGSLSLAATDLSEKSASLGVQTEQCFPILLVTSSAQTESLSCSVPVSCHSQTDNVSRHTDTHTHSVSSAATQTDPHTVAHDCTQTNPVSETVSRGAQTMAEPCSTSLKDSSAQCASQATTQLTTKHQRQRDTRGGKWDTAMLNSRVQTSPPVASTALCLGCASSSCRYKSPECPAATTTCMFCRHIGHFSQCCRK